MSRGTLLDQDAGRVPFSCELDPDDPDYELHCDHWPHDSCCYCGTIAAPELCRP